MGISYRDAGVDIDAGEEVASRLGKMVKSTFGSEVLSGPGGFGALFAPDIFNYREPVLVSGADGVGTKLKIAFMMGKHDTVGIDLVAMNVNDILTLGARPLFFLDYLATGKMKPDQVEEIVAGIVKGCQLAGCALIGGESAEMPGFYSQDEYDLAGFSVGIVDRPDIISGERIKAGDGIIGLAASGIHSNGYSLARKVLFELAGFHIKDEIKELKTELGQELLKPTRIYVNMVLNLLKNHVVNGIAHITGGGIVGNLPRILPAGNTAAIKRGSWPVQPIFDLIQKKGQIELDEMYRTFNMGIGMILIVPESEIESVLSDLNKKEETAYLIGRIEAGKKEVKFNED